MAQISDANFRDGVGERVKVCFREGAEYREGIISSEDEDGQVQVLLDGEECTVTVSREFVQPFPYEVGDDVKVIVGEDDKFNEWTITSVGEDGTYSITCDSPRCIRNKVKAKFIRPVKRVDWNLVTACRFGRLDILEGLVNAESISQQDNVRDAPIYWPQYNFIIRQYGCTPLYRAAENGHVDIVKILIKAGADINVYNRDNGCTPLYRAVDNGHLEIVKFLIKAGADVDICDRHNYCDFSPLYRAAESGHLEIVKLLMEANANVHYCGNKTGINALFKAAENGHFEIVKLLIEAGIDCDKCDENDFSPLYRAAENGHLEIVKLLIENGANILLENYYGYTPLLKASENGHLEIVKLLINTGADFDAANFSDKCYPLFLAAENGHAEIVEFLIDITANVNKYGRHDCTPLYRAAENGHLEVVKLLVAAKADVNICKIDNRCTPLYRAAEKGQLESVKLLVSAKADVNKCNKDGCTPLFKAVENGHLEIVKILIKAEADVNICDKNGCSPLYKAAEIGHLEIAKLHIAALKSLDPKQRKELVEKFFSSQIPIDVKSKVLLFDIPYDPHSCSQHFQHTYLWTQVMDASCIDHQTQLEIVNIIAEQYPAVIPFLARSKDEQGRETISIVCKLVRDFFKSFLYFCGRYELQMGPPVHRSQTAIVMNATDHGVEADYDTAFRLALQLNIDDSLEEKHLGAAAFEQCIQILSEEYSYHLTNYDGWEQLFQDFDANRDGLLSHDEYKRFCTIRFGEARKVAIKFMCNKDQWSREVGIRRNNLFEEKFVVGLLPGPSEEQFKQAVILEAMKSDTCLTADYLYGFIMKAADRNLDSIYRQERPDVNKIRQMMRELADAVKHVHSKGVMHGDIKLLNALRFGDRISLIDMDAAATLYEGPGGQYAGAKFSSGVLPPEMFAILNNEQKKQYDDYWRDKVNSGGPEFKRKMDPRISKIRSPLGNHYVVRTFDVEQSEDGEFVIRDMEHLPYDLVPASTAIDIWSFGVILYNMCTGETLLQVNRDDDLTTGYDRAATWTEHAIASMITNNVSDERAQNLLIGLLQPDPQKRISSMQKILEHDFFTGASVRESDGSVQILQQLKRMEERQKVILEETREVKQMTDKAVVQIQKTERLLMRAIFEATEVCVPSCFVIVPHKLKLPSEENASKKDEPGVMKRAAGWVETLYQVGTSVAKTLQGNTEVLNNAMARFSAYTELYLYLVDEYTMQPVIPDKGSPYPIVITQPADFVPKVLPLLKIGLKAMAVVNGVGQLGRCLGYPLPALSADIMAKARDAVGELSADSSVAEYSLLQAQVEKVGSGDKTIESNSCPQPSDKVRGLALRELQQLLAEHDEKNTFCSLRRVCTEKGTACWTLEANVSDMQASDEDYWRCSNERGEEVELAIGGSNESGLIVPADDSKMPEPPVVVSRSLEARSPNDADVMEMLTRLQEKIDSNSAKIDSHTAKIESRLDSLTVGPSSSKIGRRRKIFPF